MNSPESPIDRQVRLLEPVLDYCDVRDLVIRCGSQEEAESVGQRAVANYAHRLRFDVQGPTLRITFIPPDQR